MVVSLPVELRASLGGGTQGRTDHVKGGADQLPLPAGGGHGAEGHHCQPLVGPAHPVADRHRRVGRVVAQQFRLHLLHMAGAEVEAQGGLQGGKAGQRFPLGHTGAAAGAAEHDRLHQPGNREFAGEGGGGGLVGAQARHHLHLQPRVGQPADLLLQGAVEAGIAVVEAHHPLAFPRPLHHNGHHLLESEGAGAQAFAAFRGEGGDRRAHERVGPHQHLGLLEGPGRPKGEQIGCSRTRPHDPNRVAHAATPAGSGRERWRPYSHQRPRPPRAISSRLTNWAIRRPPSQKGGAANRQRGSMRRPSIHTLPLL